MRVAALYDIHGNLPALEAVLTAVREADADLVVVGGDVFPGPMPRETLACLRELDLPTRFIMGNGDRETLAQQRGIESSAIPESYRGVMRWVAQQLDADLAQWVASWPPTVRITMPSLGDVLFCHATPRNDTEIFSRETSVERLLPVFANVSESLVVCGHTHIQFDRMVGAVRVVNAGSVGMPFGEPGAYWLLLGEGIQLCRTEYNLANAAKRVEHTNYPQAKEFASGNILRAPSEHEVLAAYAQAELM